MMVSRGGVPAGEKVLPFFTEVVTFSVLSHTDPDLPIPLLANLAAMTVVPHFYKLYTLAILCFEGYRPT